MPLGMKQSQPSKGFFIEFGQRMAHFRKEANLTQAQLAQKLGLKQQLVAAYEKGIRRIPVSYLTPLAQALAVQVQDLLGLENNGKKRGPAPLLLKKLQELQKLPPAKRKFALNFLDTLVRGS